MRTMYSVSLLLVFCAVFAASVSATGECGPDDNGLMFCKGINQCYYPSDYNCIPQPSGGGNFLCHVPDCLCGQSTCYTSGYGCKNGGLTQNPNDKDGRCGGGSGGDPLMRGFDGCRWLLNGESDKVYSLIASPEDTLNSLLVPANLTDADHNGNGTYHGTLFFRHLDHTVQAAVSAEGNLSVTVDGVVQPLDSRFHVGNMKGKVVRHMPFFGQYAEIITPSFTYAVQAVQPVTGENGHQRGHADIDISVRKPVAGLHGLLGQSYQHVQTPQCSEDYTFPGEGKEEDYVVAELTSIPINRTPATSRRRLIEVAIDNFPLTATTSA